MTSNEMKVVEAFVAAINRHDLSGLSDLMTEDHAFVDPTGSVHSGRQNMVEAWKGYFAMFPDYRITVEKILADGVLVAAFGSAVGTYNGKRGMVPENRIAMPAAWKAVVADGKIKLWQVYADWTEGCKIMEKDKRG